MDCAPFDEAQWWRDFYAICRPSTGDLEAVARLRVGRTVPFWQRFYAYYCHACKSDNVDWHYEMYKERCRDCGHIQRHGIVWWFYHEVEKPNGDNDVHDRARGDGASRPHG